MCRVGVVGNVECGVLKGVKGQLSLVQGEGCGGAEVETEGQLGDVAEREGVGNGGQGTTCVCTYVRGCN